MPPQDLPDAGQWDALARYVAGESSADETATLERELSSNPDRAALVQALNAALSVADPVAPTVEETRAALTVVLGRRDRRAVPSDPAVVSLSAYRSRWHRPALAAAAVLVVVAAGFLLKEIRGGDPRQTAAARTEFSSPMGAMDTLSLPDGSRVLLGPGSKIALSAGFTTGERELVLQGEARFDVVHIEERPFVVHSGVATFRDVGTVFAVRSDVSSGARIVVTEGAVAVQAARGGSPVMLNAGDRAVVAPVGSIRVERGAAAAEDIAWTEGQLVFRDAGLDQVAADVRRWFGLELRVDSSLARQRLNVAFDRNSGADVGRTIAAMIGGEAREDGRIVVITPTRGTPPR